MTTAEELRALADRVPADGPPAVTLARQRAAAAEAVTAVILFVRSDRGCSRVWTARKRRGPRSMFMRTDRTSPA
jgi:hypothetical protein